jgi:hypothetical protein
MSPSRRYGVAASIAGVVIAVVAAVALSHKDPPAPPPAPKFPARDPPPHPIFPSEPTEKPPEPFCEGRDIFSVGGFIRAAQKQAAGAAAKGVPAGAPPSCHDDAAAAALSKLIARTRACVARDRELDSQWDALQSSVSALDRCIECTHARADRLIGCRRVLELVAAAEKATPADK